MKYLLDTCVISELVNPHQNEKVVKWILEKEEKDLFLSVLTIGELYKGIARLSDSKKKRILTNWVEKDLKKRFSGRIIGISLDIAIRWGLMQGASEKKGIKLPVMDGLIAASAIEEHLTVVTRNTKDINPTGAKIVNPWNQ